MTDAEDPVGMARETWKSKDSQAWGEIRAALRSMSTGSLRCMYCEDSAGRDIDHYHPKSSFPFRAYDWQNYLWACSICNSNYKRDRFPTSKGRPTLIDPTRDDPADYLEFDPRTGKWFAKAGCVEGRDSIEVFGLSRAAFDDQRKAAWTIFGAAILLYAKKRALGDRASADKLLGQLRLQPFSGVLAALLRFTKHPRRRKFVDADVLAVLDAYPELHAVFDHAPS
ncbi:HNH endonuclease [Nannocystaceae bacterium ST9]